MQVTGGYGGISAVIQGPFRVLKNGILTLCVLLAGSVRAEGNPQRWLVYYGPTLTQKHLDGVALAIVDPDNIKPKEQFPESKTRFIAYLSLGEVADYRFYWPLLKDKPFLVEKNPHWGSYRIDIRSSAWQSLLLDHIIPEIIGKGYAGLFLDTIDTAGYLEDKDPKAYKGSRAAMVAFIRAIHKRYPDLSLYPNNGLEYLREYQGDIAGVVVEDVHTRYDFERKIYEKTPDDERAAKEKFLDGFRQATRKPVLNILYEKGTESALAKSAIARSSDKGYAWYLTTVDLLNIGRSGP